MTATRTYQIGDRVRLLPEHRMDDYCREPGERGLTGVAHVIDVSPTGQLLRIESMLGRQQMVEADSVEPAP